MAIYIPVDLTNYYRPQTLEIEDEINARSTARFGLVDATGALEITDGSPIEIYDYSGNLIFGGFVMYPNRINQCRQMRFFTMSRRSINTR